MSQVASRHPPFYALECGPWSAGRRRFLLLLPRSSPGQQGSALVARLTLSHAWPAGRPRYSAPVC